MTARELCPICDSLLWWAEDGPVVDISADNEPELFAHYNCAYVTQGR